MEMGGCLSINYDALTHPPSCGMRKGNWLLAIVGANSVWYWPG